jgi:DNA-binding transcriptional MerR regulator
MSDNRLTIGKVAELTGCHIETIRYYEKEKLLPPPERSEGGNRLYNAKLIERLVFIRRSRELGFQLPLGATYIQARGYASPDVGATFERARNICATLGGEPLFSGWAGRIGRQQAFQISDLTGSNGST